MEPWVGLAARQYGLVERSQLRGLGLTDDAIWRRARAGIWSEVRRGVYRVADAPRSWYQDVLAACLWASPLGVASHRAAAGLWELEGFGKGPLEISTPKQHHAAHPLIVHRVEPDRRFVTEAQGIPVTNPSRTLMDLAGVVEAEPLERALDDALRRGMTSIRQLRWGIAQLRGPGRRGVGALSRLLDQREPGSAPSVTEFQGRVRKLLAGAGLEPVEEYEIRSDGKLLGRVDFAFPEQHVAVEADGYAFHSGRLDWQHDRTRRNALTKSGWRVLHVTWEDLTSRPGGVVADVKDALSWGGAPEGGPRPPGRRGRRG